MTTNLIRGNSRFKISGHSCIKKIYIVISIISILCTINLYSFAQETGQKESSGKIAFSQLDGQYWQIWIMNLDGSNKKQLTDSLVDKRSPDFSSVGNKIVYVTNEGELWVMDSDGNNQTKIPLNISASEPKWCFKDSKIIFTSYRGEFFLDDSDIWIVNPALSKDSSNLRKSGVNIDGSDLKKIIRRPSLQFLPEVSQDEKEILFVDVLEISSHEIFKLILETGDYIQLTNNNYHDTAPVYLPDLSAIVYSSDKDGNYDIWIMDRFGQNPKNLTHHPAFDSSPVITKDGKTIFFLSDRTKTMQIWSRDIEGNNLKQITNDNYDKQDISVFIPNYESKN